MTQSAYTLEIQLKASLGLGWEDIYYSMLQRGLVVERETDAFRKYVLGLGSAVARRYST